MKKINNKNKLNFYIEKYNINNMFSVDMTSYMDLYLFNKDEHIYKAGCKMDYFYFFVEGKSKVYILLANGKSLLLMFCNPLRIVGDVEFLYSDIATCNLQALTECLCIGISLEDIRKYASNDSTFLRHMCKSLGEKLTNNSILSSINLLYPLENRLASYILAIVPQGKVSPAEQLLTQKLTEIAELLGTSYRHLIRVINKLCDKEIIKKEKNALKIINRAALEELAGDLYN
ncbi:cyclic nucleotide-binding domain-containing protein [Clostridium tunisiense]|uniref:cyclic nucleotide-binding domain-containing protein n=1 Tax=Clostridium tunisiense TaxID=219748 RepID=UPI000315635B|nr:cyclic nucleotide-binding domain-containing protein [Clostridium tunisiense]